MDDHVAVLSRNREGGLLGRERSTDTDQAHASSEFGHDADHHIDPFARNGASDMQDVDRRTRTKQPGRFAIGRRLVLRRKTGMQPIVHHARAALRQVRTLNELVRVASVSQTTARLAQASKSARHRAERSSSLALWFSTL
jgi:hypothetical protein